MSFVKFGFVLVRTFTTLRCAHHYCKIASTRQLLPLTGVNQKFVGKLFECVEVMNLVNKVTDGEDIVFARKHIRRHPFCLLKIG